MTRQDTDPGENLFIGVILLVLIIGIGMAILFITTGSNPFDHWQVSVLFLLIAVLLGSTVKRRT